MEAQIFVIIVGAVGTNQTELGLDNGKLATNPISLAGHKLPSKD